MTKEDLSKLIFFFHPLSPCAGLPHLQLSADGSARVLLPTLAGHRFTTGNPVRTVLIETLQSLHFYYSFVLYAFNKLYYWELNCLQCAAQTKNKTKSIINRVQTEH